MTRRSTHEQADTSLALRCAAAEGEINRLRGALEAARGHRKQWRNIAFRLLEELRKHDPEADRFLEEADCASANRPASPDGSPGDSAADE